MIIAKTIKLTTYSIGDGYIVMKLLDCPGDNPMRLYLVHNDFAYLHPLPLADDEKIDSHIREHIQVWIQEYYAIIHEVSGMKRQGSLTIIKHSRNINTYNIEGTGYFIVIIPMFDERVQGMIDHFWLFHMQHSPTLAMFGLENGSYDIETIIEGNFPEYMEQYREEYF